MHIFLPGASGFVGERVLNDLLAAGYEVTALTHSERSRSELQRRHPALNAASGDVASENDILRAMPAEIDAVVYLPGLLREFPRQAITFRGVHVEGVRNTLAAAKRAGVRRWIQLSALGTQANSATEYFRTKFDAEQLVQASGLEWTILRPALIFNDEPRRQHNFVEEVAKAIRMAPLASILGSGKYLLQPVSLEDVSQTILQSLSKPATIGKIFQMGGPEKMTYLGVVRIIAQALGTKKPAVPIPLWAIMSLARLFGRFSWFPITANEIVMLRDGNYVRDAAKEREVREVFDLPMKRFSAEAVRKALR